MNNLLLSLSKCNLFKNISHKTLEKILLKINYKIKHFEKKEIIFSPFQISSNIGIILYGCIHLQKILPNGKMIIFERKNSFDSIAEPYIFSSYEHYPTIAFVHKTCEILFINKKDLELIFKLNTTFLLNYLESLSNLTLNLKHKIAILSLNSINSKIASYLLHNFKLNNSSIITLPFSKKAWAEYMDVSRTSLSRDLKKLEEILLF